MKEIVKKFKEWKMQHPDEDYQYDEIHNFVSQLSRGELLECFDYIEFSHRK